MKRRLVVALVFLLAVGLCGGLIWFNFFRDKMIAQFFATMQPPPQTVSAAKVEAMAWTPSIGAIGTAKAANGVELAVQVGGVVKEINFKPNDRVAAGKVLVQLDDAVDRADLANVQAQVKLAEANFARSRALASRGITAEATFEQNEASLATARAQEARVRAVIEQKALKAPFSGVAGIPRIDIGQYVQPGTVVASFQDLSSMKVDFTVPEQRAGDIRLGQELRAGVTEADLPFKGRVIGKDPKVDPKTRLVSVQALIEDNKDGSILPGQFLHVEVILPEQPNVVTLPQTAVITSLYGDYVYTIEQEERAGQQVQVVKQVFVKTGRRRGGSLEILSGLNPGQQVVASGQNKLQAGSTVKIDNSIDVTKLDTTKLANGQ
ncbi:efflux RND transporter periplasmic adaptor subunit [Microvirga arsenatis]|uniref:Efflux RND transporter periplasmic adaptor subunit n=1 Tax=Microvirga arsenatis TaxID=2692265 RepID=A0ABW9Z1S3_9HYPH|nr:efflux RND transporter periplasmic adaptor subunit [Microvirga arsenatis]NBJ10497.1 efflux RND transporter periplasmic adaptor subunit [Microvirga arsenatis]NBJ24604.1 efflux RND transporter periplasmic adaptor subunit [Microvirga arsenatis]